MDSRIPAIVLWILLMTVFKARAACPTLTPNNDILDTYMVVQPSNTLIISTDYDLFYMFEPETPIPLDCTYTCALELDTYPVTTFTGGNSYVD